MWNAKNMIRCLCCFQFVRAHNLLVENHCDITSKIILATMFQFFSDQHYMTIIDITQRHGMDVIACAGGGNDFRPVDVFNHLTKVDFRPEADPSSVSSYPITHGYFFRTDDFDNMNDLFAKLSKHNPRTKIMLSVTNSNLSKTEEVLRVAFEDFHMLNVATTSLVSPSDRGSTVNTEIRVCLYNPFSGDSSTRRPEFRCFYFKPDNFFEESSNFEEFHNERIENLQGFPLKISIFTQDMKSLPVRDDSGKIVRYDHADGNLVDSLAKRMNFTPVYKTISDGAKFGFQKQDGSFAGSLGAIEDGKVDLAANPMLITNYNTRNSIFLHPITMTKLNFIIKKRYKRKPMMLTIFTEFDRFAMIVAISFCVLLPFVYCIVHKTEIYVLRVQARVDVMKFLLYVVALQVSMSMKPPSMTASRLLVASILFYALILNSIFQGTIIKDLNSNQNVAKISEINQLLDQNFTISMQPVLTYAFQNPGPNRVTRSLYKISKEILAAVESPDDFIERLQTDSKLAYLTMDIMTGNHLNNFYDNETGENCLEVIPESAFEFYVAMLIPKSSPFFERFNEFISLYVQAGLYLFDTKKAIDENDKVWIHRLKHGLVPKTQNRPMSIYDLQNAFKEYICFVIISFVVFLVELSFPNVY